MAYPEARTVELRDGRAAVIRPFVVEDAAGILALDRAVVAAGDGVLRSVEGQRRKWKELETTGADGLRRRLEREAGGRNGVQFVAVVGDEVVGLAEIHRIGVEFCRHSTALSVEVRPDHQGQGLGRRLMESVLDWARTVEPPVLRVGLFTRADNHRAIALYESLGFEHEGLRRRFARLPDGTFVDDVVMALLLD